MTERIIDYADRKILIGREEKKQCNHPEHNPPQYMVFKPGRYRHTCPGCGKVQEFDVYPSGVMV